MILLLLLSIAVVAQAEAPLWVNEGTEVVYDYTMMDAEGRVVQEAVTTVTVASIAGGHAIIVQQSTPFTDADGVYAVDLETREVTNSSLDTAGQHPFWLPVVEAGDLVENQLIPCMVLPMDPAQPDYVDLECEVSVETEDGPFTVEGTYRYGRESRLMFMSDLSVVGESRETLVAVETHFAAPRQQLQGSSLDGAFSLPLLGVTAGWVAAAAGMAFLIRRTGGWTPVAVSPGFCTECGAKRGDGFRYCVECGSDLAEPGGA